MNIRITFTMIALLLVSSVFLYAQRNDRDDRNNRVERNDRNRPVTIKDQILIKLDSIDLIYFSRLKTRDKFEARRKLDNIAQLVDRLEDHVKDRERALMERERLVADKEKDLQNRERDRDFDRNRERDRDRDRDRDKDVARISPISLQEFDQLLGSVERTPFDQDKKKIVRTSAMNNYFLVDQVIKLASKFPFDNDRLEAVEILYPRILDLDKNYLLYNCFTFSDSKNKLERFIEENSKRK